MSTHQRFLHLKALRIRKIKIARAVKDSMFISLGVMSAAFGLKGFLLPNNFLDGGVVGVSLLTNYLTNIDVSILLVIINLPFIVIGYTQVSKLFAVKTLIAIVSLSVCLALVNITMVTNDTLLVSFFGGFFVGLGIGLSIRGGSVIDGTEVLAIYTSRKTALTVGDIILILNIIIF
jgi:uncharacterized membrane-anchored protein YitT (DUF2179 family)